MEPFWRWFFLTPRPLDIKIVMEDKCANFEKQINANFEKQINAWLTNIR